MATKRTSIEIRPIGEHPEVEKARDRLRALEAELRALEDERKRPTPSSPVRRAGFYAAERERLKLEVNTVARPALSEALHRAEEEHFAPARQRLARLHEEVDAHREDLERIAEEAAAIGQELRKAGLGDFSALAGKVRVLVTLPRRFP